MCAAPLAFLLAVITPHGRFLHFKRLTIHCFLSETIYTIPMMIDQTTLISVHLNNIEVDLLRQRRLEDVMCSFTGALMSISKLLSKKELLRNDQRLWFDSFGSFLLPTQKIWSACRYFFISFTYTRQISLLQDNSWWCIVSATFTSEHGRVHQRLDYFN
jgi:hypothetical protein